ncbi:MAG TPA: DUF84 family protein [Pseudogracilibacillus sp.]|nr:DUF84 family protein [Pseudogracilibacillus sp.]
MNIVIGSKNKTKIAAVETVFPNAFVHSVDAPSDVSNQPIGDEETRLGAMNRAYYAQRNKSKSIGIGLEGGVMYVKDQLYLCNWGALQTEKGNVYTAAGARITLPNEFKAQIKEGYELAEIMNVFTEKKDIRNHEGAIGIFTNDLVDRSAMFVHVVTLLKGQYKYDQHKVKGS